jgi:general nucleoside transport system ATP-binding protein
LTRPIIGLEGITKRYPGIVANDAVDLDVLPGEIHAVVGENGAGKTTLMRVLAGLVQPDRGEIRIDGESVTIRGPRRADALGIGMVHQHFMLIPPFTVAENVLLGRESRWATPAGRRASRNEVATLARDAGFDLEPGRRVEDLSVAQEQCVEILRVLSRSVRVLILDEPTALLAPPERSGLFDMVRRLRGQGTAVLFVTHRLSEVMGLADRVTVLRHGRRIATRSVDDVDEAELAHLMVGREVEKTRADQAARNLGDLVLEARDVRVLGDRGGPVVNGVGLDVRAGEIVGIAAIEGNGQREFLDAVVGLRPCRSARLAVAGHDAGARWNPAMAAAAGVGHIPADRLAMGLVPDMTCAENLLLGRQREPGFGGRLVLATKAIRAMAARVLLEQGVEPADPDLPAGRLSGGNQQKLVVARELTRPGLRLLVANHPTRGVDIGAIEAIHGRLLAARDRGVGVLVHSHDLEELRALSDRMLVMYRGRVVGETTPDESDEERLGRLMTGMAS